MNDYIVISKADLNGMVHKFLKEAMDQKPFISQNAASKILGRRRLERAMKDGSVDWHKLDYDNQFSKVMVKRKDVEKLLNEK